MKVKITSRSDDQIMECDGRDLFRIECGDFKLVFADGEPEDNSLCRNFSDVFKIDQLVRLAYNAGKIGEELEIVYVDKE